MYQSNIPSTLNLHNVTCQIYSIFFEDEKQEDENEPTEEYMAKWNKWNPNSKPEGKRSVPGGKL